MRIKRFSGLLVFAVLLAACNDGDDTPIAANIVISHVPDAVLSAFFVDDWTPFEAAASALRTLNPLYTIQRFTWQKLSGPPDYDSYSITNSRVEYAHAAGLTGAGQIISIVDSGFLQSHGEFAGKTIYLPGGGNNPGVDHHGTSVASVAAGIAGAGQMIGVAPGADLQLGYFGDSDSKTSADTARAAANNQAASLGAIVQNNSWGFDLDVSNANFQDIFSDASGTAYYNSILNLAQNSVIVFAASNDQSRTSADIMSALPLLVASLQNNWLTVINAVPTFNGSTITSAAIVSAGCLEAAAWCLAADGAVYAAQATGGADYDYVFGTSFAAPQVSGAIALLAEAFPTLSASELRARLLASADNGFYTHTGYVEFTSSVRHGFSNRFGHGFLNMRVALSPIGGSYLPRSFGGSVVVTSPTVLSAGMAGDALGRRLAQYDLIILDGMGTGFERPASVLTAQGVARFQPLVTIADLLATEMSHRTANAFASELAFSPYASGRQAAFQAGDLRVAMLVPDGQSGSFGLSLSRELPAGPGKWRLGLSAMHEAGAFVGVRALLPGETIDGTHVSATLDWRMPLAFDQQIALSAGIGVARPSGGLDDFSLSPVAYNSLHLSYSFGNIWGAGDRLALGIGLPQAIGSGRAQVTLPVAHSLGATSFDTVDIGLAADARQVDLSIAYGVPVSRNADILFRAVRSFNDGNIAGQDAVETAIGVRFRF